MATSTYEKIAVINSTTQATQLTFNNIPQTYRHLFLTISGDSSYFANTNLKFRVNSNGSYPEYRSLGQYNNSGTSTTFWYQAQSFGYIADGIALSNNHRGIATVAFPWYRGSYSGSTEYYTKPFFAEAGVPTYNSGGWSHGGWEASNSPVSRIDLYADRFQNVTLSLYGVI